jgi:hypothetical protein
MRSGNVLAMVGRPAVSGAMRARQTKRASGRVNAKQWLGYVVVAAATTWLTKKLDDLVDRRFGTI